MTKPETTEDFTAASPDGEAGSAKWARRLPLRLPARLPIPRLPVPRLPIPLPKLRRARETEPLAATSPDATDTASPESAGRLEPTHRLEGFELRSVASTALLYYGCAFLVLVLGVVLIWFGASMFGVVGRVEEFMRGIGFRDFNFAGFKVITGGILLSVSAVAFLTVMTVLGAAFYNLLGRPHRGVKLRLTLIEPEPHVEPSSDESTPDDESPVGLVSRNGNGNGNGSSAH